MYITEKELSFCHKLKFSNLYYTSATWLCKPMINNILPSNIKLKNYNFLFRSFIEYGISALGRKK